MLVLGCNTYQYIYITWHYLALHYIMEVDATLHYITAQYNTLHHTTLPCANRAVHTGSHGLKCATCGTSQDEQSRRARELGDSHPFFAVHVADALATLRTCLTPAARSVPLAVRLVALSVWSVL